MTSIKNPSLSCKQWHHKFLRFNFKKKYYNEIETYPTANGAKQATVKYFLRSNIGRVHHWQLGWWAVFSLLVDFCALRHMFVDSFDWVSTFILSERQRYCPVTVHLVDVSVTSDKLSQELFVIGSDLILESIRGNRRVSDDNPTL